MDNSIAAIILTKNEEKHIARCINSIKGVCEEIWVIDSFSTDKTCEIARIWGLKSAVMNGKIIQPNLITGYMNARYIQSGYGVSTQMST